MADESNGGATSPHEKTATVVGRVSSEDRKELRANRAKPTDLRQPSSSTAAKTRTHSDQERAHKLQLISSQVSMRGITQKEAIRDAGISEQTYYLWKRTAKVVDQTGEGFVPAGDQMSELIALDAENQRLRIVLIEKLRAENADLRARLGLE